MFLETIKEEFNKGYAILFEEKWPAWVAGILIALISVIIFLWNSPLGITGGYQNWGNWMLYYLIPGHPRPEQTPWQHTLSLTNIGLFVGALASALLSRQFKFRPAPPIEYAKGIIGGVLMGTGSALASGCNVGAFYTGVGVFSLGGYSMMIGLGVGAFLGLKLLLWEMEHIPAKPVSAKPKTQSAGTSINWTKVQQAIGGILLLSVIAAFYGFAASGNTQNGGLLFFGLLLGLVFHRSRFCFVRAFRDPFMTGESEMVKAIALSLVVYGFGSAVIKWSYIQPPNMGVVQPFWIGTLLGGTIFGIGMVLAGGCGTSTLWRAGEGHVKLMITLVCFALSNALVDGIKDKTQLASRLGEKIFMPDLLSWQIAIPVFLAVLMVWVILADWNEKTEKLVIS
jgi:uncharacterized membrane protein YedE/YeeE